MNASIVGSDDWWTVVLDMPAVEAVQHLDAYRLALIDENQGATAQIATQKILHKIKIELKILNQKVNNQNWLKACDTFLDRDVFDLIFAEKRRLDAEMEGLA